MAVVHHRDYSKAVTGRTFEKPAQGKPSLAVLAKALPPVVYFMRTTDGLVKIGYTTDLHQRKRHFGSGWEHILAITPGTKDDEKALHERFAEHLARGREYFRPAPELVEHINTLRAALGVSPTVV